MRRILKAIDYSLGLFLKRKKKEFIKGIKNLISTRNALAILVKMEEEGKLSNRSYRSIDIMFEILLKHFNGESIVLTEIAREYCVSRERVRQLKEILEGFLGQKIKLKHKVDGEAVEKMILLFEEGKSFREIAKELGMNVRTVSKIIRKIYENPKYYRQKEMAKRIKELINQGYTWGLIRKELNIGDRRLRNLREIFPELEEEYFKCRRIRQERMKKLRKSVVLKPLIVEMLKQGLPPSQIARELGTCESYVHQLKKELIKEGLLWKIFPKFEKEKKISDCMK